jgi:hypothetical protein
LNLTNEPQFDPLRLETDYISGRLPTQASASRGSLLARFRAPSNDNLLSLPPDYLPPSSLSTEAASSSSSNSLGIDHQSALPLISIMDKWTPAGTSVTRSPTSPSAASSSPTYIQLPLTPSMASPLQAHQREGVHSMLQTFFGQPFESLTAPKGIVLVSAV